MIHPNGKAVLKQLGAVLTVVSLFVVTIAADGALARGEAVPANSPRCLVGRWKTTLAESRRITKTLVPGPYEVESVWYMEFKDGIHTFGTSRMRFVAGGSSGDAAFFTLQRYSAVRGRATLAAGRATLTIDGNQIVRSLPRSQVPFQCNASRLKWRGPGAVGWMTLSRAAR